MKLYLASSGMPNPDRMRDLIGKKDGIRVASIRAAWEPYSERQIGRWVGGVDRMFDSLGADMEIIDLKQFADKGEELLNKLSNFDLVWAHGGNTFSLNYRANKSGFNDAIKLLVKNGLVYGGDSAGAVLATPTLHSVELEDDINATPETYWDGMGMVSFGIIPHWSSANAQLMLPTFNELKKHVERVITLKDGEFIIVDGQNVHKY